MKRSDLKVGCWNERNRLESLKILSHLLLFKFPRSSFRREAGAVCRNFCYNPSKNNVVKVWLSKLQKMFVVWLSTIAHLISVPVLPANCPFPSLLYKVGVSEKHCPSNAPRACPHFTRFSGQRRNSKLWAKWVSRPKIPSWQFCDVGLQTILVSLLFVQTQTNAAEMAWDIFSLFCPLFAPFCLLLEHGC